MAYRISSFAEKCGVNKETIRYYREKNYYQNLIEPIPGIDPIQKRT